MENSDEELIVKYLKGDEEALKTLIEKYTPHSAVRRVELSWHCLK